MNSSSLWLCVLVGVAIVGLSLRLRESPLMLTDSVREALATSEERVGPPA
jgi:hypothetical protein